MKEKRYFVEIIIKDSETLEPVRSISTSSDYPESVLVYPHVKLLKEVHACVDILCSIHSGNDKQFNENQNNNSKNISIKR